MTLLSICRKGRKKRKLKMKKLMVVLGSAAMVALSGCYAAKKYAESIGIIGGKITVEQKQSPDNSTTERRNP